MKGRRRLLVAVSAALVATVVAAVAATSGLGKQQQRKYTIAFVPPVIANPTIKALNDGIKVQSKSLGMNALTVGGEYNPQAQIVAVNAAIQRKVDAILIWPLDPKGIEPSFDRARQANIPLFVIWDPKAKRVAANFQYDDYGYAVRVAKLVAAELKKQGKPCAVGIIQGIPVVDILRSRNEGLAAGAKAAGCEILEQQVNTKDNTDGAKPIVDAWKTKHGSNMTAVLAYNDPSAMAAVAAAGGSFTPLITGMNADSIAVDALKAGALFATVAAPNVELGNAMAYAAYLRLAKKQLVPKQIWLQYELLTRANVSKYVTFEERLKQPLKVRLVKVGPKWFVRTTPSYVIR
jgi:ABC-type sugar transport system substrate-binding protein